MSRTDCPSQDTLSDFVLGKLPVPEQGTVAEHLDVCTDCEQKIGQLDAMADEVVSQLRRISGPDATEAVPSARAGELPSAIESWGEFRIVRELGRGGMGVVCEAYQGSLNRHVALKFLPEHGNLARFRREAQAAGRLHHTHIVPVFGVGEHRGRHFYVMQYIVGRGLDAISKDRAEAPGGTGKSPGRPGSREAARIGVQVAEALAYAHGQGVIHRDIKPSNLLLDDQGTVWVTDFGLAKVADQQDLTGTGDLLGTVRYMPPEAFEGRYDARGDIYALGLTLYELIALRPAYDESDRARLIRLVTIGDPPRLRDLDRGVPRDLDTVIHKAIERDPAHRYQTAAALAEDLKRFLEDRPIRSRRIGELERFARWCRRNPGVTGLAASLIGFLILATIGSLIGLARMSRLVQRETAARWVADRQKDAAEAASTREAQSRQQAEAALRDAKVQRDRAEANFAKARAAVDDYLTRVSESRLFQVPGMQPLRRDLLQSALGFYQDFLKERGDDPTIFAGLAAAHLRVGRIVRELGQADEARWAFQQARDLYRALAERSPHDRESQGGLAEALDEFGQTDEAIAIWERLVRDGPDLARYERKLADAYDARAFAETQADRSLTWHLKALALREALVRRDPEDPRVQAHLGQTLINLGLVLGRQGQSARRWRCLNGSSSTVARPTSDPRKSSSMVSTCRSA